MSRHSWVITLVVLAVTFLTVRWLQRQKAIDARLVAFKQPPPDPNVLALRGTEFYVRLQSDRSSQMSDAIRAAVGSTGTVYPREEHAVVLWNDFRAPEDLLGRLSHDLRTEVIWLAFQKTVDAFAFQHWKHGERLRRLTFGCHEKERTWEEVDGTPEPWEAQALFSQEDLEFKIELLKEYSESTAEAAREEERLRSIWRERRLEVDSDQPNINGRDAAEAVAIAYGLPGWQ